MLARGAWLTALVAFWRSSAAAAAGIADESSRLSNDSLLWGPYRPNLYFGVRPRVKGSPRDDAPSDLKSTVVFYAGIEGFGNILVANEKEEKGYLSSVNMVGETIELGTFQLEVTRGRANRYPKATHPSYYEKPLERTFAQSLGVTPGQAWQAKGNTTFDLDIAMLTFV
ncbi:hypothetical protein MRB53_039642 [Persea americana]|nr:hypothetical protein MRB53_039642 [Persea americana]